MESVNQNSFITLHPLTGSVDTYSQNFGLIQWEKLFMSLFSHFDHRKWSIKSQELLAAILQQGSNRYTLEGRVGKNFIFGDIIQLRGQT